jgi:predicted nuclease of predicted toxin-antitoxin system
VARLYADEQFPLPVVQLLRPLGHDVLTVQEAGNAGLRIPDEEVLAFAVRNERAVLTLNRQDYIRLHRLQPDHAGIIVCSNDRNWERLATRINQAISTLETLSGNLIRVNRPQI